MSQFSSFDGIVKTCTRYSKTKVGLRCKKYRKGRGHPPCVKGLKGGGRSPGLLRPRKCSRK